MCDTCGCSVPPDAKDTRVVDVLTGLLDENDRRASHNREHLRGHDVLAINLMSSPGAGKTRLLEETIERLRGELRIAVIEGDLETENDATRIRARGVPAVQITTGSACHLDAAMVHHALHEMDLAAIDLLFIENVGNLVCPASFDLGHHASVVLLSVTEGDDKPAKYPVMFRVADAVVLSKLDLLEAVGDFSLAKATAHVRELGNPAPVLTSSARNPAGIDAWLGWLREAWSARRTSSRAHHHRVAET